jgi:hypothetical protein
MVKQEVKNNFPMRDALARISGNQRSTTSTENPSGTRRTPMADLCSDLNRMWTEMDEERNEEEITHKALRLQLLMSARDIAANSMEKHENEALGGRESDMFKCISTTRKSGST